MKRFSAFFSLLIGILLLAYVLSGCITIFPHVAGNYPTARKAIDAHEDTAVLYQDSSLTLIANRWFNAQKWEKREEEKFDYFAIRGDRQYVTEFSHKIRRGEWAIVAEADEGYAFYVIDALLPKAELTVSKAGAFIFHLRKADGSIIEVTDNGIWFFPLEDRSRYLDSARTIVRFNSEFNGGKEPNEIMARLSAEYQEMEVIKITLDSRYIQISGSQVATIHSL